ncbi:hypothetical protein HK097_011080 [Rhizophlyctis rosea]|uniref:Cell cycle control protein 50A n=1 Tax=Rhizophlyctis rosea TaxID=64517 RepID=A0AAD5SEP6_9FUNG|nr:hypothetical protein HK097_011080 [Rhizophlyctis rosea]
MPPQEDRPKTKKPANTAFKQQRLKAWQPILTPKTVLPTFFIIGAIFVPIGIGLYIASDKVSQVIFDYTFCQKEATSTFSKPTKDYGPITEWRWDATSRACTVRFEVDENFNPPVFLYYRLTNFYQNHRRYVKSFDTDQLKGTRKSSDKLSTNCDPLKTPPEGTWVMVNGVNTTSLSDAQYYPCGLIANSMFSDEIGDLTCISSDAQFTDKTTGEQIQGCSTGTQISYLFQPRSIAWPSDADRFKSIKSEFTEAEIPTKLIPPPMWRSPNAFGGRYVNGYTAENLPDLHTWERFQVWMRTAGLPNFRKLYGRNNGDVLPKGIWEVAITDNFPVENFAGTKSVVISTVSIIGGKNPFLGVAYMAVGAICWALGLVFLLRHMIKPRKLGDHTYLSWNQPQGRADGGGERTSLMNR